MKEKMKEKMLENLFFFTEAAFLIATCGVALYNIYYDKTMIPLLVVLAGYILTIKAFRRIFIDTDQMKKKKAKIITFVYLTSSSYMLIHLSFLIGI